MCPDMLSQMRLIVRLIMAPGEVTCFEWESAVERQNNIWKYGIDSDRNRETKHDKGHTTYTDAYSEHLSSPIHGQTAPTSWDFVP